MFQWTYWKGQISIEKVLYHFNEELVLVDAVSLKTLGN